MLALIAQAFVKDQRHSGYDDERSADAEKATQNARAETDHDTEKITDRWLAAQADLTAGETVLHQSDMAYLGPWLLKSHGRLHLTSDRLIWIRWRTGLPIGPRVIEMELRDVRQCSTRRSARSLWRNALVVEGGCAQGRLWFLPLRKGGEANAWCEAVTGALRILSAEAEKSA